MSNGVAWTADASTMYFIDSPTRRITACAFGGVDLRDLYVTSARMGLTAEELRAQPRAGGLFRGRLDTSGVRATMYAG